MTSPDFLTIACFAAGIIGSLWFTAYAFLVFYVERLEALDEAVREDSTLTHRLRPRFLASLRRHLATMGSPIHAAGPTPWDDRRVVALFQSLQQACLLEPEEREALEVEAYTALRARFGRLWQSERQLRRCAEDQCWMHVWRSTEFEDLVNWG